MKPIVALLLFIACVSTPTGKNKRLLSVGPTPQNVYDVRQYGAVGDGVTLDDSSFAATIADIEALDTNTSRGAILQIPFGKYHLHFPILVRRSMIIQGVSGSGYFAGSYLLFDSGSDGIIVNMPSDINTTNFTQNRGDWTVIRDLAVVSSPTGTITTYTDDDPLTADASHTGHPYVSGHGIILYARAKIENVLVSGFRYDGIHVESIDPWKNANNFMIEYTRVQQCGRHGLFVAGENSNQGAIVGLDSSQNHRWGVYERSFLGNNYIACHTANNTAGGYKTTGSVANNLLLGCYSEADNHNEVVYPTLTIGGTIGGGLPATAYALTSTGVRGFPVRSPTVDQAIVYIRPTLPSPTSYWQHNVLIAQERSMIVDTTNGLALFVLPTPSTAITGYRFAIKRADTASPYSVHVISGGGKPIDGKTTHLVLGAPNAGVELMVDGTSGQYRIMSTVGTVTQ